ncbi:MAG: cell division protein FtsA [Prolixibacteraceae bacterium]|nr:cell division protein FtsA [Prolixibacteraceae bacterium]
MTSKNNLSVVIDLGTSKLAALAGRESQGGKIEILGMAQSPSKGIKRGLVFNIDEAASAVNQVLAQLELQLDEKIGEVNVAFAGQHLKTVDFQGVRFTSEEGIVSQFEINELYNEALNFEVGQNVRILHVEPRSFVIDDEVVELNPVGITGRKIEANFKLLTVPEIQLKNIQRVFDKTDFRLGEITLAPLAVSEAGLTNDEKELGAVLLDIGAGTAKVAVYYENVLVHTAVIPFGGNVVTKDIKEGCSILIKSAEQLKVRYGQALGDFADDQKVVTIPGRNGWEPKEISFKSLAFIIQARLEEIIDSVNMQIEKSGVAGQLGAGIVIAGGTSNLENIVSLIKFRTGMDARIAVPVINTAKRRKELRNHEFLTSLGLLKLTLNNSEKDEKPTRKKTKKKRENGGISPLINKFVQGMLDLVDDENEDVAMN